MGERLRGGTRTRTYKGRQRADSKSGWETSTCRVVWLEHAVCGDPAGAWAEEGRLSQTAKGFYAMSVVIRVVGTEETGMIVSAIECRALHIPRGSIFILLLPRHNYTHVLPIFLLHNLETEKQLFQSIFPT